MFCAYCQPLHGCCTIFVRVSSGERRTGAVGRPLRRARALLHSPDCPAGALQQLCGASAARGVRIDAQPGLEVAGQVGVVPKILLLFREGDMITSAGIAVLFDLIMTTGDQGQQVRIVQPAQYFRWG